MSGINVKAKAYAFAFTFIRIEKVGNKELERIHTMVLSLQLLPFLSLRTGTHRYRQNNRCSDQYRQYRDETDICIDELQSLIQCEDAEYREDGEG